MTSSHSTLAPQTPSVERERPPAFPLRRAVISAVLGYVVYNVVLYVFRLWTNGQNWNGGSWTEIRQAVGLVELSDWTLVGLSGAVLGFIGGAWGFRVYRQHGALRGLWCVPIAYAIGASVTMLIRMAFGLNAYSEPPVAMFGIIFAFFGFIYGLGGWSYWLGYIGGARTPEHEDHSNHGARRGWRDYFIFNTDHKVIGLQYIVMTMLFMAVGGAFAESVRAELANPQLQFFKDGSQYNQAFSLHGVVMLFLFIIPVFAGIANYVLPIMLGAPDMAYPRLNALSFWTFVFGGFVFLASIPFGAFEAGWTNYATLSTSNGPSPVAIGQLFWLLGLQIVGASSIMTAINFLVSIIALRAPGMTMWRMPLLVWSNFTTSLLVVFGTPFVAGSQFMVMFDLVMGTGFFKASLGGDPIAYQHIFWFYSHPAVYIMMIPGFGIMSEVITTHARKPVFGYRALAISTIGIGFLGFTVWAHHMFSSGMADWFRLPMMFFSMLIAVPTGIKILGWSATLWKAKIHFTTGMMFALGMLFTFTCGGLTGVMVASVPFDIHVTDTYFVVAHFHYVLFGGSVMTVFAGLYHWFPKMTGRMYDEKLGRLHFWLTFIGLNVTFFPMHWLGTLGMPRRVADYEALSTEISGIHAWNSIVTLGALIQGVAFIVFVYNMANSWARGPRASANPWKSRSLEWLVSSPPPLFNFHSTPVVVGNPYDFGLKGAHPHALLEGDEGYEEAFNAVVPEADRPAVAH